MPEISAGSSLPSTKEASMSNEQQIEEQIVAAGRTAPRVTPALLDREVAAGKVVFTKIEGTNITHCAIVLRNGFSVTGESACVDPANFDEQIGRDIALKNAREKLWPLLGFRLADELYAKNP